MTSSSLFSSAIDYRSCFESLPGLYLILSTDFTIVGASNAYLRATRTTREEICGRNIFDAFPDNPDDPHATGAHNLKTSLERVRSSHETDTMPLQKYDIQRKEAEGGGFEARYWSPINTPVIDEKGRLHFIIHRVEDVTEFVVLQQQETAQRTHAEKMETEIFLRSQEIAEANQRLHLANQTLEEMYAKSQKLDQLKTHFFANISHELRTPLTLILGPITKHLASSSLTTGLRHDLQIVERNAQLLLKQVSELLDVAKIEAKKATLEYSHINLATLVRHTASNFDYFAKERNIDFVVHAPSSLAIEADEAKLQRCLLNLLSNAFKFTPTFGRITVTLEEKNAELQLTVSDTGPGIPIAMRQAVFERFHQLQDNQHRQAGGTGLGLTIVKEFVELHRGTIAAGGSEGEGTIFTLSLPLKAPPGTVIHKEIAAETHYHAATLMGLQNHFPLASKAQPAGTHGALILLVEDNPDMRMFLTEALSKHYRLITAINGKDGLEKALMHFPDLIISDVMMPEMDGEAFAHALLTHPEARDIPLLLLSARTDNALKIKLLKQGVRDYIYKPFSIEELSIKAEQLITTRKKILMEREHLLQQLARSNQELEQFAYIASHDLKSPLRAIDSLAQWIADDLGDALQGESRRHMDTLQKRVRRMERLLDDLLDYARINRHLNENSEIVDGATLMKDMLLLISLPDGFTFHLTEEAKILQLPRMPLQQIFYNLVVNAIKHHDKSQGTIEISVKEDETYYYFSVKDDGPGIATPYHQKIFDMFQKLKPKDQCEGSGMGLALVKKIITTYGGDIWVESVSGEGCIFHFTWPKTLQEDLHNEQQHSA